MLRRQIDTNDPVSSSIVIDQCAIDISTPATDGGRTMPIATLVIDPVAHRVLGLALSLNISPKYVARALVDALLQTGPHTAGQEPTIKLNVTANIAWRKLSEICVSSGTALEKRIKKQIIGGDWTSKLIGQRLADFHLRPKMTRFTENLRLPTKIEMSLAEAEELLRARIHADAPHESAFSSMPELQRMELLRKLAGFAL
ncbi:hypothetical protein CA234_09840 [Sphingomonas sp. ABOLE]|nr:hypothetical protein CA234_09840 [Sphingomonas sp. ABOLE]